jgi:steroid delta-isomerase-like uncharacterized protein
MSPEENKEIIRRFYEYFSSGKLDQFDEVMTADVVDHNAGPQQSPGVEGVKQAIGDLRKSFPDLTLTVEDILAEGDQVMDRTTARGMNTGELFGGMPPTGRAVEFSTMNWYRIQGEKIVEVWHIEDLLGMMQQLGLAPTPGG